MRTRSRRSGTAVGLAVALSLVVGCGGGDDPSQATVPEDTEGDAPAGEDASASDESSGDESSGDESSGDESSGDESSGDEMAGDESAGDESAGDEMAGDESAGDESAGDESAGDESSGGPVACDGLLSPAEVEEWFGEPAQLTEEYTESLGQTVCTWETIEDPDDLDDLAFELIVAQVYSGDPMSGSNFVDPDIFEDVTMLDGIGDLAFSSNLLGTDYAFLDGDVAGFLSSTEVNMGDVDAEKRHTPAEVEAMFRRFHERVMAG